MSSPSTFTRRLPLSFNATTRAARGPPGSPGREPLGSLPISDTAPVSQSPSSVLTSTMDPFRRRSRHGVVKVWRGWMSLERRLIVASDASLQPRKWTWGGSAREGSWSSPPGAHVRYCSIARPRQAIRLPRQHSRPRD